MFMFGERVAFDGQVGVLDRPRSRLVSVMRSAGKVADKADGGRLR